MASLCELCEEVLDAPTPCAVSKGTYCASCHADCTCIEPTADDWAEFEAWRDEVMSDKWQQ